MHLQVLRGAFNALMTTVKNITNGKRPRIARLLVFVLLVLYISGVGASFRANSVTGRAQHLHTRGTPAYPLPLVQATHTEKHGLDHFSLTQPPSIRFTDLPSNVEAWARPFQLHSVSNKRQPAQNAFLHRTQACMPHKLFNAYQTPFRHVASHPHWL